MSEKSEMAEAFDSATASQKEPEANDAGEEQKVRGTDRVHSEFFASVRRRGILNAMLDTPAKQFEAANPDQLTRWEYAPQERPDINLVVAREAMGFRKVRMSELPGDSALEDGPVRCGDMVLMTGPRELTELLDAEDAKAARDDWLLPKTAYQEALEQEVGVQLKDGSYQTGKPVVEKFRMTQETFSSPLPEHEVDS
jgi:hypothetical protein